MKGDISAENKLVSTQSFLDSYVFNTFTTTTTTSTSTSTTTVIILGETTTSTSTTTTTQEKNSSNGGSSGGGSGGGGTKIIVQESDCEEDWICFNWLACENGIEQRECRDRNHCRTAEDRPETVRVCGIIIKEKVIVEEPEVSESFMTVMFKSLKINDPRIITSILMLLVVILFIIYLIKRRK